MTGQHCPECGCELGASLLDACDQDQFARMLSLFDALGRARSKLQTEIQALMKAPGVVPAENGLEAYWTRNDEHPSFQGHQMVEDFHLLPPNDPNRPIIEALIAKYTRKAPRTYFNVRRSKPQGLPVHSNPFP